MPRKGFLLNPAPDTGGARFQEGNVRVDRSVIKVYHPDVPAGQDDPGAKLALIWNITRLNEDLEPLLDDDEPLTEELAFPFGSKSLNFMHPGNASGPEADEEDVEDLGDADNTEGPTYKMFRFENESDDDYKERIDKYQIHSKSGITILYASMYGGIKSKDGKTVILPAAGVKEQYVSDVWAPHFEGCVFEMKNFQHPEFSMEGRDKKQHPVNYKIVSKVHTGPGEKAKKAAKAAAKAAPAAKKEAKTTAAAAESATDNGQGDSAAQKIVAEILESISTSKAGESMSLKAFQSACKAELDRLIDSKKVAGNMTVPVMTQYKDKVWMKANAPALGDLSYDPEADGGVGKVTVNK